jgi:hypothetical protein
MQTISDGYNVMLTNSLELYLYLIILENLYNFSTEIYIPLKKHLKNQLISKTVPKNDRNSEQQKLENIVTNINKVKYHQLKHEKPI